VLPAPPSCSDFSTFTPAEALIVAAAAVVVVVVVVVVAVLVFAAYWGLNSHTAWLVAWHSSAERRSSAGELILSHAQPSADG